MAVQFYGWLLFSHLRALNTVFVTFPTTPLTPSTVRRRPRNSSCPSAHTYSRSPLEFIENTPRSTGGQLSHQEEIVKEAEVTRNSISSLLKCTDSSLHVCIIPPLLTIKGFYEDGFEALFHQSERLRAREQEKMTADTLFGFKDFIESESFITTLNKEVKSSCFDSGLVAVENAPSLTSDACVFVDPSAVRSMSGTDVT
ncbi:hypothetical protein IRJ41_006376 [Triplophysa rosa]|uniref:Uncharacterized protein n=1 Tax=Triplophysa rosa TaxID=992332 RepID=A0A9W8CBT6_TRIRA|nr:hypothetical protein IRJ41_006376 [Triplophysa rosa]